MTGSVPGPLRVSVLGYGSIGSVVVERLRSGAVPGARLVGVVCRSPIDDPTIPQCDLGDAIDESDIVVECASQEAVWDVADRVLTAGRDLLVSSVGALSDPDFARGLTELGPGRIVCTHGAVGGLDLLAAAGDAAPFDRVLVRTTKTPASLVQPWMDPVERARVRDTGERILVFEGPSDTAVRRFPKSLNVAAAVGFAVRDPTLVTVQLYADPAATLTCHEIEACGPIGRYAVRIENLPSEDNPRTSAVVPFSILRTLAQRTARPNLIA